jgi:NADPH:quinone reductase-like Zn-dependent oxidoreductase
VRAVGEGVQKFKTGDRVFGVTFFNGYASQICVPERQIFPLPDELTFVEAAAFPAVFMTAYHALFQLVRLPEQATILVHSAGGGVGSALIQLAKVRGMRTVGVVGSSHKIDYVKSLGADTVIDKSKDDLWTQVHRASPNGYDAVLDANGPETLRGSYAALRPTGKLIAYGSHGILPQGHSGRMNYIKAAMGLIRMPRFDPLKLITDNKSVIGFNLSFLFDREDLLSSGMDDLRAMIQQGKLQPPKVTHYPVEEVAQAHRLIESGQSIGKMALLF